jgi:hypothetical protein
MNNIVQVSSRLIYIVIPADLYCHPALDAGSLRCRVKPGMTKNRILHDNNVPCHLFSVLCSLSRPELVEGFFAFCSLLIACLPAGRSHVPCYCVGNKFELRST